MNVRTGSFYCICMFIMYCGLRRRKIFFASNKGFVFVIKSSFEVIYAKVKFQTPQTRPPKEMTT